MKLYIKQKVFSLGDKFTVKDEYGEDKYYVESELFTIGKKLHVYDINHNEVAFIRQKAFAFFPRFFVYKGTEMVAEIVKEISFFSPKYRIEGLNWEISGDFFQHEYSILENNNHHIADIHKEWLSWGDCYMLDIADYADEIMALAVILAIDCVNAAETAAASNT